MIPRTARGIKEKFSGVCGSIQSGRVYQHPVSVVGELRYVVLYKSAGFVLNVFPDQTAAMIVGA
jgi:hypothetical protein